MTEEPLDQRYERLVTPRLRAALRSWDRNPPRSLAVEGDDLPQISVILAARDRPAFLSIALECYRRQTYPWRELIVVDDGGAFPADQKAIAALGGRLIRVPEGTPLGTKLNLGASETPGSDLWFLVDQVRAGVSPAPIPAAGRYVCVRHDSSGVDRGHTWTHLTGGLELAAHLRTLEKDSKEPVEIFPKWALSAYSDILTS